MLADEGEGRVSVGALDREIHLPREWLSSLVRFIGSVLPLWRDDPQRPAKSSETALTALLSSHLTDAARHAPGWDFLQFKQEEPDETVGNRTIDLAVAPSGSVIWIEDRRHTKYNTLLPIECKRLPTPSGADRDEREYLYSKFKSTGGIQRFKAGNHAVSHDRAAMIGYIQDHDITFWNMKLNQWIDGIVGDAIDGWSDADKLGIVTHDTATGIASLCSNHLRRLGKADIQLDHLWIEMRSPLSKIS